MVKIPWLKLFPHRQTWAFSLGKFMTDPVWWFFLFWLPKYFSETFDIPAESVAICHFAQSDGAGSYKPEWKQGEKGLRR